MKKIAAILLLTTTITQSQANTNNINAPVSGSNVFQGNDIRITENHYHVTQRTSTDKLLKNLTDFFSDSNSDRAFRNKKYRLAAEILDEAYETAKSTRRPKKTLLSILSKKSIAEGYFDKTASYNTLLSAIKLDKYNILLQEAAANTAIDIYRFDLARSHLESILKNRQLVSQAQQYRVERYEANFKLHVISTLERKVIESVNHAIACSKIFRTELTQAEQEEVKANQVAMLQVAIHAGAQMAEFPKHLISEYVAIHKIINPQRTFNLIGTDKDGIWISITEEKPIRQDASAIRERFNVYESTQETPSYSIGESLESLTKPISEILSKTKELNNPTERDVLRAFLSLHEELIEPISTCKDCAINPLRSSLGLIMIASVHEILLDTESAHFYYSLALRRLQKSNDHLRSTPHYRFILASLYEKIGIARGEIIGGTGPFANKEALEAPFSIAIKTIEELSKEQSGNTEFTAKEIELRELYSNTLTNTFNFDEVKIQCSKVQNLFNKLNNNAYIIDEKIIRSFLSCTRKLIVLYKQDNELEKLDEVRLKFINSIKSFNQNIDPLELLGAI